MAKVMISIPDDFLKEVDKMARREHRSRSELLREALRQYFRSKNLSYPRPIDNPMVKNAIEHMRKGALKWRRDKEASQIVRQMRESRF